MPSTNTEPELEKNLKMPPSLQTLPNELKQNIIAQFDILPNEWLDESSDLAALLNLRLTSKDLQETAASRFNDLFSNLTIHLLPSSLKKLAEIATSETLSKAVKKLAITTYRFSAAKYRRAYHHVETDDFLVTFAAYLKE
ncbi:hypothetical protein EJ08DRAFT_703322 [Tothia fuscella]|uniref:F-box domain-containing protein n=1 Tax=Tothia fuscella TaxID=1048955 RepID=A0A9P4TRR0_9PEZI|nr:hypothetical protein EJ08DRAFT_703322 [Tothia fuscella]